MPVREPGWWYRDDAGWPGRLLDPVSRLWGWTAKRRIERTTPERSSLPVICVGNFTAGGTGKTPLSILIARRLLAAGERPLVLTRGYGGRLHGPHKVNPSLDTSNDVGDEPLLLARHAPVIVARDRVAGARLAEADAGLSPPTVIVMDDGLQNPKLAKDLSIAVMDATRGFGNGRVIPAGPLRAPLDLQFALADAIVINSAPGSDPRQANSVAEKLRSRFHGPVLEARVEAGTSELNIAGQRVLAYSGIANPRRFHALLEAQDAVIVRSVEFADHHPFTEEEAESLLAEADRLDAQIVTTEKDLMRLSGRTGRSAELAVRSLVLPIHLALDQRDDTRLTSLIEAALKTRRKDVKS